MKPIGGYFELECGNAPLYHQQGVYLNLCRSALRYAVRVLGIRKCHVPYYTCHTVAAALTAEKCEIEYYPLDDHFLPAVDFPKDDFIIYNNYFGVLGKNVDQMASRYPNLIVDNAQAFYSRPRGRVAVYSPRKFFGLPDGGIAIFNRDSFSTFSTFSTANTPTPAQLSTLNPQPQPPTSTSYSLMSHLLKRHDLGPQEGYADFVASDERMETMPVMYISNLTRALMGNLNYEEAAQRRRENFAFLREHLPSTFPFAMADDDVPLVYPVFTDDKRLRTRLIQAKIFVPSYWPGTRNSNEYHDRILPLPIDQRYDSSDMNRILEEING